MTETDEKVLCVWSDSAKKILAKDEWYTPDVKLELLLEDTYYRNRHTPNDDGPDVEHDDRWKQLIPYIVCVNDKGQILAYNRGWKGGEDRLKGRWAIGFGGHINDQDESFLVGIVREIREELEVGPVGITGAICENAKWSPLKGPIGFIDDDSDDVGRHHLGVVYVLRADEVVPKENPEWKWRRPTGVETLWDSLENWARLALPMVRAWMESEGKSWH